MLPAKSNSADTTSQILLSKSPVPNSPTDTSPGYTRLAALLDSKTEQKQHDVPVSSELSEHICIRKCCCNQNILPRAHICNCMCCGYITIFILILLGIIFLIIYSLIPHVNYPQFAAVYMELYSYSGFTEDLVPVIYINGTGKMIVEIKNNMNINGYLHDVEYMVSSINIMNNEEQFGIGKCCESPDLHFNASYPFNPATRYKFNKEVYVPSKRMTNISMLFEINALSEEIWDLMINKQMVPENRFLISLILRGYAHIKSKEWGIDIKLHTYCSVQANTSKFVLSKKSNDLLQNVWPPRLYYLQKFPVYSTNCTYSITSVTKT